jgi:hypothetical protein
LEKVGRRTGDARESDRTHPEYDFIESDLLLYDLTSAASTMHAEQADEFNAFFALHILKMRESRKDLLPIADVLNAERIQPRCVKAWSPSWLKRAAAFSESFFAPEVGTWGWH